MIGPTGNVRVYLACGVTDMRRGIDGLSAMVEAVIKEAPGSGAIFGFRGKRADRVTHRSSSSVGGQVFGPDAQ